MDKDTPLNFDEQLTDKAKGIGSADSPNLKEFYPNLEEPTIDVAAIARNCADAKKLNKTK
jgi:hypothetical protein